MNDEQHPDESDAITEVCNGESAEPENPESGEPGSEDELHESVHSDEPESFPRSYVEELRQENGRYRQRAQAGEAYAQRLHTELVRATGRLADPTDLPFDAENLDDPDKLTAAVEDLLTRKPHLASRRPFGEIGQGAAASAGTVDLAAILRQQAG